MPIACESRRFRSSHRRGRKGPFLAPGIFIGTVPKSVTLFRQTETPRAHHLAVSECNLVLPIRGSTQICPLAAPPRAAAAFHTFARSSVGFPRRAHKSGESRGEGKWEFMDVLYICTLLRSRAGRDANDDDTPHAAALCRTSHSDRNHAASTHHPRCDPMPACRSTCGVLSVRGARRLGE